MRPPHRTHLLSPHTSSDLCLCTICRCLGPLLKRCGQYTRAHDACQPCQCTIRLFSKPLPERLTPGEPATVTATRFVACLWTLLAPPASSDKKSHPAATPGPGRLTARRARQLWPDGDQPLALPRPQPVRTRLQLRHRNPVPAGWPSARNLVSQPCATAVSAGLDAHPPARCSQSSGARPRDAQSVDQNVNHLSAPGRVRRAHHRRDAFRLRLLHRFRPLCPIKQDTPHDLRPSATRFDGATRYNRGCACGGWFSGAHLGVFGGRREVCVRSSSSWLSRPL